MQSYGFDNKTSSKSNYNIRTQATAVQMSGGYGTVIGSASFMKKRNSRNLSSRQNYDT